MLEHTLPCLKVPLHVGAPKHNAGKQMGQKGKTVF